MTRSTVSTFLLVIQEPVERMLAHINIVHLVIHSTGDCDVQRSEEFDEATRDANGGESEEIVQSVTQTAEFSRVALEKGLKVRWIGGQLLQRQGPIPAAPGGPLIFEKERGAVWTWK